MTRQELARQTFDGIFERIREAVLSGEEVIITGFGRFYPKRIPARRVRDPRVDGAMHLVPERVVVGFRAWKRR